jgi:hypothetical protein
MEALWEHEDPLGSFLIVFPGGCVKMKEETMKAAGPIAQHAFAI